MTRIELSQASIRDLEDAMDDPSLSDKHRTKLLVIRMHSEGARHGFIAKCLKLHANTITNHLKEWLEGGLPAVVDDKYCRPSSAMEPFMACLRCNFAAAPLTVVCNAWPPTASPNSKASSPSTSSHRSDGGELIGQAVLSPSSWDERLHAISCMNAFRPSPTAR
jgi:hypothetical protein